MKGPFPFSTLGIDFISSIPLSAGNHYIPLIGDHFNKCHEVVALPDVTPQTSGKPLWICRPHAGITPNVLISTKDITFKLNVSPVYQISSPFVRQAQPFSFQSPMLLSKEKMRILGTLPKTTDKNQSRRLELLTYLMFESRTTVHSISQHATSLTSYFFRQQKTLAKNLQ